MLTFHIKDASAFPARIAPSYRAHLEALRQGKCVEIPVRNREEARKTRISLIASVRRWLTKSEVLETAITDAKVSVILRQKPQQNQ